MMGRIFYSVAGEGRGHATRVRTVVDVLRRDHKIVLFAPHVAYDFLQAIYRDAADVDVHRIPGLQFSYRGRRVSYWDSIRTSVPYLQNLPSLVRSLENLLRRESPDLIITDFEPALPRAAKRVGLPFLSFDHQHFLSTFDLSSLPSRLWWRAKSIASTVNWFYHGQEETIVSSFFSPGLRAGCRSVTSVGVMLRQELQSVTPVDEDFLLVYLRRFAPPKLMSALKACCRKVHIYGLGELPRERNLRYFPVNENGFLDDLVNCYALISNAGNQLVGEAFALRKPVLAIPEEGNFEQLINAHFLARSGYGVDHDATTFSDRDLGTFLENVPRIRTQIDPATVVGNSQALAAIQRYLPVALQVSSPLARVA